MAEKVLAPLLLAASSAAAMADTSGYMLRIEPTVEASKLTVVPVIAAPAGSVLRYEMQSTKEGASGRSTTSQSGRVNVGADGSAKLSILRLGVGADDRYLIAVKVFDGDKLVAEDILRYPR